MLEGLQIFVGSIFSSYFLGMSLCRNKLWAQHNFLMVSSLAKLEGNIIFSIMKNSLELEIVNRIKKANQSFSLTDFQTALTGYIEALACYNENKIYNPSISSHFQSTIYSLIGAAYLQQGNLAEAEEAFTSSLKIAPYLSTSLIRRAKVLLKMNRISEAIEDLENAYIGEPDNKNISSLIQETESKVEEITDVEQKRRLQLLLINIYTVSEESKEFANEENMLSFSSLQKIDKPSINTRRVNKKSSMFSHFKQSDQNDEDAAEEQGSAFANIPVQIISKSKSSFFSSEKKGLRKTKSSFIQEEVVDEKEEKKNHSQKSRSSVKFRQNRDSRQKDFDGIDISTKNSSKVRKSCLRSSTKVEAEAPKMRISTFSNIKNIDGVLLSHPKTDSDNDHVYTQVLSPKNIKYGNKESWVKMNSIQSQQLSDSQSDNEGNEHNIYGSTYNNNNVLMCIKNLSKFSDKNSSDGSKQTIEKKKGSILRKESLIESSKGIERGGDKKKSVCFLGSKENKGPQMSIGRI